MSVPRPAPRVLANFREVAASAAEAVTSLTCLILIDSEGHSTPADCILAPGLPVFFLRSVIRRRVTARAAGSSRRIVYQQRCLSSNLAAGPGPMWPDLPVRVGQWQAECQSLSKAAGLLALPIPLSLYKL